MARPLDLRAAGPADLQDVGGWRLLVSLVRRPTGEQFGSDLVHRSALHALDG